MRDGVTAKQWQLEMSRRRERTQQRSERMQDDQNIWMGIQEIKHGRERAELQFELTQQVLSLFLLSPVLVLPLSFFTTHTHTPTLPSSGE